MQNNLQPPTPTMQDMHIVAQDMKAFQSQFKLGKFGFDPKMPGHATEHTMIVRQQPRTAKKIGSGISLPFEVRQEMALMLDEHQCALTVALHQYNKHHGHSEGAEGFISLHLLLEEHIEQTTKHIDEVGERVARLGVVSTAHPVTQHELSYTKSRTGGQVFGSRLLAQ
jgi:starvation-inducible DNA-binding protein